MLELLRQDSIQRSPYFDRHTNRSKVLSFYNNHSRNVHSVLRGGIAMIGLIFVNVVVVMDARMVCIWLEWCILAIK